ncbi:MAG TPA: peptidyl-prolyl cis-trans isomerase [Caulobacteraceae bacterium]|nr:peptidyl-prolyl cis-trans isomerase [Caulobacteraceae bacterium]
MARKAFTLLATLLAVAVVSCGRDEGSEKPPQAGDVAVARVDGKVVWASDVKREAVAQGLIGEGEPLDQSSEMFRQVLDQVVDRKLLAAEALERKLDDSPQAERRLAAARERVLADLLVEGVVEKAVSDEAIQELYQEQVKLSRQSEEVRARQIVLATEAEAQAVRRALNGGASFEALAMERSTDVATRFNGGDMGYVTMDVMPETYQAALKDAGAGQLVGPFQVEGGFAIVKVEDRRAEAPITLESARPQIIRFLTYDQVRDLLERLRGGAKVQNLLTPAPEVPGAPKEPASAPPAARP